MKKSEKHIVNERIKEIAVMLMNGYSRDKILQNTSKLWRVSNRQIDTYISKARENITSEIQRNVEYDYAKAITRYEFLFSKAIESLDYRLALTINKELSSLQGLYKMQVEHSGSVQFVCNIPD
ncbi:MAG: hypothetical protein ACLGH8_05670 [Bacteroidia bacterium]